MERQAAQRTIQVIGERAWARLTEARILLLGLGGVGGAAAEALARAGVGALDLMDGDVVAVSNLNRQLFATRETLGLGKCEAAARRLRVLQPSCRLTLIPRYYRPETADRFDLTPYDYVIDAIDDVAAKTELIVRCHAAGLPIISAMGAGKRLRPEGFRVADIYDTREDGLARVMRQRLRKRGIPSLKVVYSPVRLPDPPDDAGPPEADGAPGSTPFVPPVAGYMLAAEVVYDLIEQEKGQHHDHA